ncbi:hypothetical protein PHMEG_00014070 [Phytophthora megakarya]|uniref:Uncharacterized protein n=1 Tax=Phytophthora megakarya TaxID=4795 RepID=A0A225W591_9STRA|nr:hypothetical protein PHMEG_00014070 [Phytophthora megakarya]
MAFGAPRLDSDNDEEFLTTTSSPHEASQSQRKYGNATFVVDTVDLETARELRLLRRDIPVQVDNSAEDNDGLAYLRNENIAEDEFHSQKKARERCKAFAIKCGFQILVKQTSVKTTNSGNAKYQCKKFNGIQYFDCDTLPDNLECPFLTNVLEVNGVWKLTKANFSHNHVKDVGLTRAPWVEGSIPRAPKALRNTTQNIQELTHLVMREMLPTHARSTDSLDRKAIRDFVLNFTDTRCTIVLFLELKLTLTTAFVEM